jgi:hypothetical protein
MGLPPMGKFAVEPTPKRCPMIRLGWKPGAATLSRGPVFVSVTRFAFARAIDTPRVWWAGLRLRRVWPALPGAVGMWLWADPWRRACGAVSVWTTRDSLTGFVARTDHRATAVAFRGKGAITSTAWDAESFAPRETWGQAVAWLRARASGE